MEKITAASAKNHFGEMLDKAQRTPVTIEKHGRPVAVVLSMHDFEKLESLKLKSIMSHLQK